jgi:hypothetical protein
LTTQPESSAVKRKFTSFSLNADAWAVSLALALALLIGLGVIHKVPW